MLFGILISWREISGALLSQLWQDFGKEVFYAVSGWEKLCF
jgi:hypothetical protein